MLACANRLCRRQHAEPPCGAIAPRHGRCRGSESAQRRLCLVPAAPRSRPPLGEAERKNPSRFSMPAPRAAITAGLGPSAAENPSDSLPVTKQWGNSHGGPRDVCGDSVAHVQGSPCLRGVALLSTRHPQSCGGPWGALAGSALPRNSTALSPNLLRCKPPAAPWAEQGWAERNELLVCGELGRGAAPTVPSPAIAAPVSGFLQDDALDTGPGRGCSSSLSAGSMWDPPSPSTAFPGTRGSSQLGEAASPPFFVHNCRQGEAEPGCERGLCLPASPSSFAGLSLAGLG